MLYVTGGRTGVPPPKHDFHYARHATMRLSLHALPLFLPPRGVVLAARSRAAR